MDVLFASQAYRRGQFSMPPEVCENFYAENAVAQPDRPWALLSCPGVKEYCTVGSDGDVVQGLYREEGLLRGDLFAVCGGALYSVSTSAVATSIGSVGSETGFARFASVRGALVTLSGESGSAYLYNGVSLSEITDVDAGSTVRDVASINGRILFATGDDQFSWSEPLDPDNIDALSFATAERSPDDLKAILVNHQEVWLMGASTIEVYIDAGPPDTFVPIGGGFIERGLLTRDAATIEDNTIYWVGEDRIVYRAEGYLPVRVSTNAVEEALLDVAGADIAGTVMWSYAQSGHKFVVLRTPNSGTWVYDVSTDRWHKRLTYGRAAYRPSSAAMRGADVIVGDGAGEKLYTLDPEYYYDGAELIRRRATANTPIRRRMPASSFAVDCTKGVGDAATANPQIMLRYSDNQGRTWSNEKWKSLGRIGEYAKRVLWRMLGHGKPPGRIWEVSVSDPVVVSIYGARVNDIDP